MLVDFERAPKESYIYKLKSEFFKKKKNTKYLKEKIF